MWSVFIDGNEMLNKCQSASISTELDKQNHTFSITCKDVNELYHYKSCNIKIDGNSAAAGIIVGQSFSDGGPNIIAADIQGEDYNFIFQRRVAVKTYVEATVSDIIIDLISSYAPEFTANNVRTCSKVVELLQCDYITLSEAIKKAVSYVDDWHYYIDADMDFHFFDGYEESGNTFQSNIIENSFSVNYDASETVNRVWVVGAKQATNKYIEQYFTCDGQQRYFSLAYEPNYVEVYVNDVLMESLVEENDDGEQDFLINKSNKLVYIPDNIVTPFTGVCKVVYRPTIQIIDYFENYKSDNPYLLEKVIKNKDVTDKMSARQIGKAEISRKKSIKTYISFSTFDKVKIGQKCLVKKSEYNIDAYFLVKKVELTLVAYGRVLYAVEMEAL